VSAEEYRSVLVQIKTLIETTVDDPEDLPDKILEIIDVALAC